MDNGGKLQLMHLLTGAAIARQVLKAPYFTASKTIAVYVHCARLREVDTSAVLQAAMTTGAVGACLSNLSESTKSSECLCKKLGGVLERGGFN